MSCGCIYIHFYFYQNYHYSDNMFASLCRYLDLFSKCSCTEKIFKNKITLNIEWSNESRSILFIFWKMKKLFALQWISIWKSMLKIFFRKKYNHQTINMINRGPLNATSERRTTFIINSKYTYLILFHVTWYHIYIYISIYIYVRISVCLCVCPKEVVAKPVWS